MTKTFCAMLCIDAGYTAISSIKVALCIVCLIIADSISNQIKWSRTCQIFITDTLRTVGCVYIISTAVTLIKMAASIVILIITYTISNILGKVAGTTCLVEFIDFIFTKKLEVDP